MIIDTSYEGTQRILLYRWENDFIQKTVNKQENYSYSLDKLDLISTDVTSDSSYSLIETYLNIGSEPYKDNTKFEIFYGIKSDLNGYPSKEFYIKNATGHYYLRVVSYLVKNTLFTLTVITDEEMTNNKSIKRFLESFKLINVPKGNYNSKLDRFQKHFTINYPGDLAHNDASMRETEYGPAETLIEVYSFPKGNVNFVFNTSEIIYQNQIPQFNDFKNLDSFYLRTINGSIKAMNAELYSINDIEIQDKKGKEFVAYLKNGAVEVLGRVVFKNNRLYILSTIGKAKLKENPERDKFLNKDRCKMVSLEIRPIILIYFGIRVSILINWWLFLEIIPLLLPFLGHYSSYKIALDITIPGLRYKL